MQRHPITVALLEISVGHHFGADTRRDFFFLEETTQAASLSDRYPGRLSLRVVDGESENTTQTSAVFYE
jgi:hypothetical protein